MPPGPGDLRHDLPRRDGEERPTPRADHHTHHEGDRQRTTNPSRRSTSWPGDSSRRSVEEVRTTALAVFARGRELAHRAGLVLVDTKYEFGIDDEDRLTIIDEVHTPDSSASGARPRSTTGSRRVPSRRTSTRR
ncbi:MAG: phosphoribosylaminoimidazolesuccinocarboxamide synthase [Acidimicrobiales bacterium]